MGVEQKRQREAAVTLALALRQQFAVHQDDALERVEVFKYLGRLLVQDDGNIQVIHNQLRKARTTWARVGLPSRCGCCSTAARRGFF